MFFTAYIIFECLLMHFFLQLALVYLDVTHLKNNQKTQSHLPFSLHFFSANKNPNPSTVALMIEYQGK